MSQDSRATYIGQPPSTNLGRYTVPYRITRSGEYSLSIVQANSGGLEATYFQGTNLSQPVFTQIDPQVRALVRRLCFAMALSLEPPALASHRWKSSLPCCGGFAGQLQLGHQYSRPIHWSGRHLQHCVAGIHCICVGRDGDISGWYRRRGRARKTVGWGLVGRRQLEQPGQHEPHRHGVDGNGTAHRHPAAVQLACFWGGVGRAARVDIHLQSWPSARARQPTLHARGTRAREPFLSHSLSCLKVIDFQPKVGRCISI